MRDFAYFGLVGLLLTGLLTMPLSTIDAASLEGSITEPTETLPDTPYVTPPAIGAELVKRLQTALRALDLYKGNITGEVDALTERAIREYQRRKGYEETGIVDNDLVKQIEMAVNVNQLLDQLSAARKARKDSARAALLNDPATRDLITDSLQDETADAARDPSVCFASPTVRCLLDEALESAKAVPKAEMRNWVLGELLVAQARAGLNQQARDTVRRISDPRLIISALGQIAEAQAMSGRDKEALAAARIIPDVDERVNVYATIAEITAAGDRTLGATEAIAYLREDVRSLASDARRIAFLAQSATILHRLGFVRDAKVLLANLEQQVEHLGDPSRQDSAWGHVARSLALINDVAGAEKVRERITNEGEKTPVDISTAEAQIRIGEIDAAIETARAIDAVRFRAVVLASVARELARAGHRTRAFNILEIANSERSNIRFPYARDYAASRISLAYANIGASGSPPDAAMFSRASRTAKEIKDERLRAETAWMITFIRHDSGANGRAEAIVRASSEMEKIKSVPTQAWLLAELAENRALAGQTDWARELFDLSLEKSASVNNPWGRARSLSRLARSLIHLAEHAPSPDKTETEQP